MQNGPPQTSLGLEPFQLDKTALFRNPLKGVSLFQSNNGKKSEYGPYSIQQGRRRPPKHNKRSGDIPDIISFKAPQVVMTLSSDLGSDLIIDGFIFTTITSMVDSSSGAYMEGLEEAKQNQIECMQQWKTGLLSCKDVMSDTPKTCVATSIYTLLTSNHLSDIWHFFQSLSLNNYAVPLAPRVDLMSGDDNSVFDVDRMNTALICLKQYITEILDNLQSDGVNDKTAQGIEIFLKTIIHIFASNVSGYCRSNIGSKYKRIFNEFFTRVEAQFNEVLKMKAQYTSHVITTPHLKNKMASSTLTVSTCDTVMTGSTHEMIDLIPYTDNTIDQTRSIEYTQASQPYYSSLSRFELDQFFTLMKNDEMFTETRTFAWSLSSNMRDAEIFRRNSLVYILDFCNREKLRENTLHDALRISNLSLHDYMKNTKLTKGFRTAVHVSSCNSEIEVSLKYWLSLGVLAALRTSIKVHESCGKAAEMLCAAKWDSLQLCCGVSMSRPSRERDLSLLMEWEIRLGRLLSHDKVIPGHPYHFIDRLVSLGGWPSKVVEQYRALSVYIIVRCTIAPSLDVDCTELSGVSSLKIASACLAIAVKICNLQSPQYEFWPKRLQAVTGFGFNKISPIVTYCGMLLRTTLNPQRLDNALSQRYPDNHRYWI